ncbi:Rad1/Rec1/Rad17 [Ilyonectria sp. MPI-CAGE-AT-0026]|nr:Rad1/Rec1/Rad17 [Ilyonectria sp. MPI-CAGE-AT-0026]
MAPEAQPIFRAVATSTRPLHQLLRCINFAPRVHVQITEDGVRFAADHARVMQGVAFLDKALFSSYTVNLPTSDDDEANELPNFQISLSSVLEVIQIFGAVDVATRAQKADQDPYRSNLRNYRPDAFSNQTLGISGTCTLLYAEEGDPFKITIEESGVKTTAALTTYLPEAPEDIPFDRNDLSFKIIMQSRSLLDALAEISPTAPTKLAITVTKTSPYLALVGSGDLGSSTVDFARGKDLLETFSIQDRWSQCYKFDFIKSSTEAMRIANKVSLRGDGQGVLSLQFMVDVEGGKRSFLDFRFVPFIQHDEDEDEDEAEDQD